MKIIKKILYICLILSFNSVQSQNTTLDLAKTEFQTAKNNYELVRKEFDEKLNSIRLKNYEVVDYREFFNELRVKIDAVNNSINRAWEVYKKQVNVNGVQAKMLDDIFQIPNTINHKNIERDYLNTEAIVVSYKTALEEEINSYSNKGSNIKVIHNDLLTRQVNEIFNQLIFSNTDLVSNASAFGFTRNEEKTSMSLQNNFRLNETLSYNPTYLTVGLQAVGNGSLFGIYSDDSWSSKAGEIQG